MTGQNAQAGGFDERVNARRVDLVARIRDGVPPIEYLPGSDGMLVRGRRHQIAAPQKTGKSLSVLVHLVDMVLEGATVVVLDRENGGDLYASRLEAIIEVRGLDDEQQELLARNLIYFEFPRFRFGDEAELVALCVGCDLVVFDSQRMFLSDLGLAEDKSDDYSRFMAALVDPLFREGVATLLLDNTGHAESKRARGSSSKGDLNEVLFTLQAVKKFDLSKTGLLRLEITDGRFGNVGRWEMQIGGGVFGSWEQVDPGSAVLRAAAGFRPKVLMERVSVYVEACDEPVSRKKVEDHVVGNAKYLRVAMDVLVEEDFLHERLGPRNARELESINPYREASDPLPEHGNPPVSSGEESDAEDGEAEEVARLEEKHADLLEEVF